jgi:hypothetical protein
MALVRCKECGSEVAASAPTCPRCGITKPGVSAATLVIMRPSAITGAMHPIHVFVDRQVVGDIKNGSTATFELLTGERRLEVRGHGGMSRTTVINVQENQTVTYEVSFSALGILGGGLKLKPA